MPDVYIRLGIGEHALFLREHPKYPVDIGSLRFRLEESGTHDWIAVVSNAPLPMVTHVPRERRILVMREPSGHFPPDYTNQFGILISPWSPPGFVGTWHQNHGAHSTWIGVSMPGLRPTMNYSNLVRMPFPEKRPDVSAVISMKADLPGHRLRLRFLEMLQPRLGDRLRLYGRGFRPIADKGEAILPCQYHLVLENTSMPSYWTEKLADAYVGYAFPFVWGPPDLAKWFPPESYLQIDLNSPSEAVEAVSRAISEAIFESRLVAIRAARQHLFAEEFLCALLSRVVAQHPGNVTRLRWADTIFPPLKPGALKKAVRVARRAYYMAKDRLESRGKTT